MGVYGNTRQASKSRIWRILEDYELLEDINPDINHDGQVNLTDFALITNYWLGGEKAPH